MREDLIAQVSRKLAVIEATSLPSQCIKDQPLGEFTGLALVEAPRKKRPAFI